MNQIAFVAQGRLYVQTPRGVREVQSQFGESIRSREMDIQQRNAWKTRGTGASFRGFAAMNAVEIDPSEMPIHVTSVAGGVDHFLYTLETPVICGLLRAEKLGEDEQRLWHCNERKIGDLSRHPTEPRVACTMRNANHTSSIAVMSAEGSGLQRCTEGDSIDMAPRWIPGSATRLVFQSAGVGRNQDGMPAGRSPFSVQELDTDTGNLETVIESSESDFLAPQYDASGALYFIRRPYLFGKNQPWWKTVLDIVLLPWRLFLALFGFLNFFTMLFTGKPLMTSAGSPESKIDTGRMILWGNLIDARKALRKARGEEAPDLVPKSWELVKRASNGDETILARGVVSYDLCPDGSILYTNGSAIFSRTPDGKVEKLAKHSYIQQVVALTSSDLS